MQALQTLEGANADRTAGVRIARRAMQEPLRQIIANIGHTDPSVVLNRVLQGEEGFGFDAAAENYGDMIELGIIDPTKVVRTALQNAASIAGLMITTEAMVAEKPKGKTTSAMPPGADMDDMDF